MATSKLETKTEIDATHTTDPIIPSANRINPVSNLGLLDGNIRIRNQNRNKTMLWFACRKKKQVEMLDCPSGLHSSYGLPLLLRVYSHMYRYRSEQLNLINFCVVTFSSVPLYSAVSSYSPRRHDLNGLSDLVFRWYRRGS
jgi:hypothetical protein